MDEPRRSKHSRVSSTKVIESQQTLLDSHDETSTTTKATIPSDNIAKAKTPTRRNSTKKDANQIVTDNSKMIID